MPGKEDSVYCTQLFIGNEFVDSLSGSTFPVINPATEEVICRVSEGRKEDVDRAVTAARAAMSNKSPWRTMDASQRGRLMFKLCDLIERDMEYIAKLDTIDNGKPYKDALGDIEYTIGTIRYYAGWCDKIHGNTIPCDGSFACFTRKEPVGVVGQIIPWNFPAMMVAWKWGPALAAGCSIVLKASDLTPLSALYLGQLSKEAGFPTGVINIVPGFGDTAGAAVAEHPDIDKVAFTGSSRVGHTVMKAAAESNLKRVTFELGGKSPLVVFEDCASLDEAVEVCHAAAFANHGQNCCAGSRTFVQSKIYDEFVRKATLMAQNKKLGDPFDSETEQGPQISQNQLNRILSYTDKGVSEGAKLECGGERWGTKGFFMQPTVFSNVTDNMTIAREEIFGPVQVILRFDTLEEVIERANDTTYGLASGIITQDIDKAMSFAQAIKAGSVWINCYDVVMAQTPFGGYKQSGQGRELGEDGLLEYLETKTVTLKV